MSVREQFDVELLGPRHVDEVATLHLQAMRGYFLSELGERVLRRFYAEFCRHPYDYGVVAIGRTTGRLAAFVVGTSDSAAHFRSFYRRNALLLAGEVAIAAVRRAAVRRGLLRRLRHLLFAGLAVVRWHRPVASAPGPPRGPDRVCPVRLLSIAVAPDCQGTGVSGLVALRFEEVLRQAGFTRVGLSVHGDNDRAIAFYRKSGWQETYRSEAGLWFEKSIGAPRATVPRSM